MLITTLLLALCLLVIRALWPVYLENPGEDFVMLGIAASGLLAFVCSIILLLGAPL